MIGLGANKMLMGGDRDLSTAFTLNNVMLEHVAGPYFSFRDFSFNNTGTFLYILESYSTWLFRFAVPIAWDISSINWFDESSNHRLINSDYRAFYYRNRSGIDTLYLFRNINVSGDFRLDTNQGTSLSWDGSNFDFIGYWINWGNSFVTSSNIFRVSPNGAYIYLTNGLDTIVKSLNIYFNFSTAYTYVGRNTKDMSDLAFTETNKLFFTPRYSTYIEQHTVSTYNLSAISIGTPEINYDFGSLLTGNYVTKFMFSTNGEKLYILSGNEIHQFSLI